jgi:UDP-N-acetylmuramate--alanine ligase
LFLTDIYAAGEKPVDGINGQKLLEEIDHGQKLFVSRQEDPSLNAVKQFLKPGDILLTLGAGDISKIGEQMSESLVKG